MPKKTEKHPKKILYGNFGIWKLLYALPDMADGGSGRADTKGGFLKKAGSCAGNVSIQHISSILLKGLYVFFGSKPCQVYDAHFDVRFPKTSLKQIIRFTMWFNGTFVLICVRKKV